MSERPTHPDDADATPPKRPWTILGRLTQAVREQNWFAVGLELCIVVLGVVIGFQVTNWGQARSEAMREQTYLRQLAQDLADTEANYAAADSSLRVADRNAAQLVRAFRDEPRPPADSILSWIPMASRLDRPFVVSGTAEALVATGDLNLIRSDSLRSAIAAYLDILELYEGYLTSNSERAVLHVENLSAHVDYGEAFQSTLSPTQREALAAQAMLPFPDSAVPPPFLFDADAFVRDREAYTAVWNLWRRRYLMRLNRSFIRSSTSDLHDLVLLRLDP